MKHIMVWRPRLTNIACLPFCFFLYVYVRAPLVFVDTRRRRSCGYGGERSVRADRHGVLPQVRVPKASRERPQRRAQAENCERAEKMFYH